MNKNDTRLADWAVKLVETEYSSDVCLLLEHNSLKLDRDMSAKTFSFYIPATNRAYGLARTFIIDGIGYDLFPRSWEQVENIADVKDYNTTCLADAEILWARSDEDRQRFISLQARLQANLQNPQYMWERAVKWFDFAKDIFAMETVFEERLYKVRENAGHICDLLSNAVAIVNLRYFKHGQTNQLQELERMEKVPAGFILLYKDIIAQPSPETQKRLCAQMIFCVKDFLDGQNKNTAPQSPPDFTELAAWYQELCYTWRRVYHWCGQNDPINAYVWCSMLQNEVDEWGAKFGITETDILSSFNVGDLTPFRKRAEEVEQNFRKAIEDSGVRIDEYKNIDDFLNANS